MAIRLGLAFDTSAESWLNQEIQYDLWITEENLEGLEVDRFSGA